MAHILAKIGWPVIQLDGGYKDYRRYVNSALEELPLKFTYNVVCGTTGSGKSRLLQTLAAEGAQVLDLEQLAVHRGSVLGNLPSEAQPTQKTFESKLWQALRNFDPAKIIFVESESKKVGNLRVPESLMGKMRSSACLSLSLSTHNRVQLLMQDYAHFISSPELLNTQLACLISLHGREKISRWQTMSSSNQMESLVEELLIDHYDPAYRRSIDRNFVHISKAKILELTEITEQAFCEMAQSLHASTIPA